MKLSKPILALSCALLLAGCAEPAGTSETPAAESESTSTVEATPLEKLIEGLAAQNYTAKMTMRSGAQMLGSTTDLSLSPEEFIYLQAEDAGIYTMARSSKEPPRSCSAGRTSSTRSC